MGNNTKFYIDGAWVEPLTPHLFEVINPATEDVAGQISLGSSADVDRAVAAARRAFTTYCRAAATSSSPSAKVIDGFGPATASLRAP
jgi:aldehyde dehydrogenase (NAD+)